MSEPWRYIGEFETYHARRGRVVAVFRTLEDPNTGGYRDQVFAVPGWKPTNALMRNRAKGPDGDFRDVTLREAEQLMTEIQHEHDQLLARAVHVLVRALEDHDRPAVADKVRATYAAVRTGTAPRTDLHALFPEIVLGDRAYPDDEDARYRFRDAFYQALQMTQP